MPGQKPCGKAESQSREQRSERLPHPGRALGCSNPFLLKAKSSLWTITSFRVCGIRIWAYVLLLLREINRSCGDLRVYRELHTVSGMSLIRRQLVLWIPFPSSPLFFSASCVFACMCANTHARTHKPQTCGRITHWTKSVWKRCSKGTSPSPLLEIRKKTWVWNTAAGALVGDQEYVNLAKMLLCQMSVRPCCSVTEDCLAGMGTHLNLSECYSYLLSSWFLFSSCFPQSRKPYLSPPRTSLLDVCLLTRKQGRKGTGKPQHCQCVLIAYGHALTYLRIIYCGSSCFKETFPLKVSKLQLFFSCWKNQRKAGG